MAGSPRLLYDCGSVFGAFATENAAKSTMEQPNQPTSNSCMVNKTPSTAKTQLQTTSTASYRTVAPARCQETRGQNHHPLTVHHVTT